MPDVHSYRSLGPSSLRACRTDSTYPVAWAILHFFCSWAYVAWTIVARTEELISMWRYLVAGI